MALPAYLRTPAVPFNGVRACVCVCVCVWGCGWDCDSFNTELSVLYLGVGGKRGGQRSQEDT